MKVVFNLTENDMLFAATMISYDSKDPDSRLAKIRKRIDIMNSIDVDADVLSTASGNQDKQMRLAIASMGILSLCKDIINNE